MQAQCIILKVLFFKIVLTLQFLGRKNLGGGGGGFNASIFRSEKPQGKEGRGLKKSHLDI